LSTYKLGILKHKRYYISNISFTKKSGYVVTSHPLKESWKNTEVIAGDIIAQVKKLRTLSGDGHIRVTGSASLVQLLMEADLVDEYRLLVHPIIAGKGKRFFIEGMEQRLELVSAQSLDNGVVLLVYVPAKDIIQAANKLPTF
jgi:dihydrofolate reductase